MKEPEAFENYPWSTVLAANLVTLLQYTVSLYLLLMINAVFSGIFLLYLIGLELFTYKEGCSCCCYYGKRCYSGRGKIAPLIFKKGNPKRFCEKKVTWKNLTPTVLASLTPIAAGVYLLFQGFSWIILILTLVPLLIWFVGNPLIFGKLACMHCKQGRICCPVQEFFGKKVEKK